MSHWVTFERFTDRARRVLVLAQEEARLLNHSFTGPEHILLGLISEGEGLAAKALEQLDVSLDKVREKVEEAIDTSGPEPTGSPPSNPKAKKVMEFSSREAIQLGHNYIGTEHLLFAIVRDGNELAVQVLVSLDADPGMVRQVVQMLAGDQGSTVGRLMRTSHSRIPNPHFVRSIPGPDEYDLYGGRLRIRAIEVYDTMVSIGWRAAPMPDAAAIFVNHTMVRMRQRALPLSPTDPTPLVPAPGDQAAPRFISGRGRRPSCSAMCWR